LAVVAVAWALFAVTGGMDDHPGDGASQQSTTTSGSTTGLGASTSIAAARPPPNPVGGQGTGLVIAMVGPSFWSLDVDTGIAERIVTEAIGATGRGVIVSNADGVQIRPPPFDGGHMLLLHPEAAEAAFTVDDGTRVWLLIPNDEPSTGSRAVLVDLADGRVVRDHPLPTETWALGAFDRGLLVSAPDNRVYVLDDQGRTEQLAGGGFVDAFGDRLWVIDCSDQLRCDVVTLDDHGQPVARQDLGTYADSDLGRYLVSVAPDGRVAQVVGSSGDTSVTLDGEVVAEAGQAPTAMGWSVDGRWLAFYTGGHDTEGQMHLVDTVDGSPPAVFELDLDGPVWRIHVIESG
jgi:hypothetical protein